MVAKNQIFVGVVDRSPEDENMPVQSALIQPLLEDDDLSSISSAPSVSHESTGRIRFLLLGSILGFLIQVVSLGAYACILSRWGDHAVDKTDTDWWLYATLSALTQVDLVVYAFIWLGFTCTMTRGGMAALREYSSGPIRRREVFVTGVNFLVGIVLGAFLAWSVIDLYLGFPIPFLPIIFTVGVDLILCYMMVCCYDFGKDEKDGLGKNKEDEGTFCC